MRSLRRDGSRTAVSNVELFYDLVYVFAITQLATRLRGLTAAKAADDTILLGLVWMAWVYTTWVTNWLDPDRLPMRVVLLATAAGSLVLSAGLPHAFGDRGAWVGISWAAMQVGRTAVVVWGLPGEPLRRNFQRILCWCVLSGTLVVAGGFAHDNARAALWAAAVASDTLGGYLGFWTPGLGRSTSADWPVVGSHMSERYSAFVLIALGESIVTVGEHLAETEGVRGRDVAAFAAALAGAMLLWWVYFDRSAERGAETVAESDDPGALGHAYHLVHPVIIAGIIATAAADAEVQEAPSRAADAATAGLILGGVGLFLLGVGLFDWVITRAVPVTRLAGCVAVAALAPVSPHVSTLVLGCLAGAVVLLVVLADQASVRGGRAAVKTLSQASQ